MPPERIIGRVELKPEHQPRGNVHHFEGGRPIARPFALEIVRRTEADTCNLLFLDEFDGQMAETWHPSVKAAMYHAKWEYGIEPAEWQVLSP